MRRLSVLALAAAVAFRGAAAEPPPRSLSLQQAQEIALKQHPRISVANLTALAAKQSTKEVQSAFFPNIYGSVTAVGTTDPNDTRLGAGGLNNPLIYDREAEGITIGQLITDFGRSWELTKSAKSQTRAQEMNLEATREQILLEVNNAYFSSLTAQSVLKVAEETVKSRQKILQQTSDAGDEQIVVRPRREFCQRGFRPGQPPAGQGEK